MLTRVYLIYCVFIFFNVSVERKNEKQYYINEMIENIQSCTKENDMNNKQSYEIIREVFHNLLLKVEQSNEKKIPHMVLAFLCIEYLDIDKKKEFQPSLKENANQIIEESDSSSSDMEMVNEDENIKNLFVKRRVISMILLMAHEKILEKNTMLHSRSRDQQEYAKIRKTLEIINEVIKIEKKIMVFSEVIIDFLTQNESNDSNTYRNFHQKKYLKFPMIYYALINNEKINIIKLMMIERLKDKKLSKKDLKEKILFCQYVDFLGKSHEIWLKIENILEERNSRNNDYNEFLKINYIFNIDLNIKDIIIQIFNKNNNYDQKFLIPKV